MIIYGERRGKNDDKRLIYWIVAKLNVLIKGFDRKAHVLIKNQCIKSLAMLNYLQLRTLERFILQSKQKNH